MAGSGIRFTDVLTNASTIAALVDDPQVGFGHLLDAIGVLTGERGMEEFGPGVSPLVRGGRHDTPVDPEVRAFALEWFAQLGGDVMAELDEGQVGELRAALEERVADAGRSVD